MDADRGWTQDRGGTVGIGLAVEADRSLAAETGSGGGHRAGAIVAAVADRTLLERKGTSVLASPAGSLEGVRGPVGGTAAPTFDDLAGPAAAPPLPAAGTAPTAVPLPAPLTGIGAAGGGVLQPESGEEGGERAAASEAGEAAAGDGTRGEGSDQGVDAARDHRCSPSSGTGALPHVAAPRGRLRHRWPVSWDVVARFDHAGWQSATHPPAGRVGWQISRRSLVVAASARWESGRRMPAAGGLSGDGGAARNHAERREFRLAGWSVTPDAGGTNGESALRAVPILLAGDEQRRIAAERRACRSSRSKRSAGSRCRRRRYPAGKSSRPDGRCRRRGRGRFGGRVDRGSGPSSTGRPAGSRRQCDDRWRPLPFPSATSSRQPVL
jgi:hypothetical protein